MPSLLIMGLTHALRIALPGGRMWIASLRLNRQALPLAAYRQAVTPARLINLLSPGNYSL